MKSTVRVRPQRARRGGSSRKQQAGGEECCLTDLCSLLLGVWCLLGLPVVRETPHGALNTALLIGFLQIDLAVAWLAFDAAGRSAFIEATGDRHDRATWIRAHALAASIAVILLAHSDDNPDYARLGAEAAAEVLAEASPA